MYQRLHSFSTKTNPSQISSIVVFTLSPTIFYYAVMSLLDETQGIVLICLYTLTLALTIFFALWTGQIDPTDQITKAYIIYKREWSEFLRINELTSAKVIVHCQRCSSKKQVYNAHCSICKRCIDYQDHHCAFLNTCIGQKNYKHFLITVIMAFTNLFFFIVSFSVAMWNLRVVDLITLSNPEVILSIIGVTVDIIAFLALGLLLVIHIYLNIKNITTREWVHKGKVLPRQNVIKVKYPNIDQLRRPEVRIQSQLINDTGQDFKAATAQTLPQSETINRQKNQITRKIQLQSASSRTILQINERARHTEVSNIQKTSEMSSSLHSESQNFSKSEFDESPRKKSDSQIRGKEKFLQSENKLNHKNQRQVSDQNDIEESSSYQIESVSESFKSPKHKNEIKTRNGVNQIQNEVNDKEQSGDLLFNPAHLTQRVERVHNQSKMRNFIMKNRILSSIIGVNNDDPEFLQRNEQFWGNPQKRQSMKYRMSKNQSMGTIKNQLQQADGVMIVRRMKTTVELDQQEIDVNVEHTNKKKSDSRLKGAVQLSGSQRQGFGGFRQLKGSQQGLKGSQEGMKQYINLNSTKISSRRTFQVQKSVGSENNLLNVGTVRTDVKTQITEKQQN